MIAAYRTIDRYRRTAGDIAGVLDLQLTMVESGTAHRLRYGDRTASFDESMTMVMDDFVTLAHEYPAEFIRADLGQRLCKLTQMAESLGWGFEKPSMDRCMK